MQCKRFRKNCLADTEKLRYSIILLAEIQGVRMEGLKLNFDSSDDKIEEKYINLDTLFATLISATRLNQA